MYTIIQNRTDSTDTMIIRSSQVKLYSKYDVLLYNVSLSDARDILSRWVQDRNEVNAE